MIRDIVFYNVLVNTIMIDKIHRMSFLTEVATVYSLVLRFLRLDFYQCQ